MFKPFCHCQKGSYLCAMQKKWYGNSFRLGMVGGGQLGRMFIQEAVNFDVGVHVLDADPNCPCNKVSSSFTQGSINDYETLLAFGRDKDLITVEIENVSIEALEELERQGKKVFPQPRVLKIIKDKGLQKQFYADHGIPTAPFKLIEANTNLADYSSELPFVQKLRTGGYDGKGVQVLRKEEDFMRSFSEASILEEMIPFQKELAVLVARNEAGEISTFPVVECEFSEEANLVELLFSPAEITPDIEEEALELAEKVIRELDMVGILAVEMFLTQDNELLVNEIAPRPHNSGHHTIECNVTSQFEQHLRSILNLPLGSTKITSAGAMINLLGEKGYEGTVFYDGLFDAIKLKGVHPHIYGKPTTKPFRKMGHITISGDSVTEVKKIAHQVKNSVKVISK